MNSESKPQKPKRRWLWFSLRSILIVMTIFLVWLGWYVSRVRQQQEAVAWAIENGGDVTYDFEFDWNGSGSRPAQVPEWLLRVLGPEYFSSVAGVSFGPTQFVDITMLSKMQNLRELHLGSSQVKDFTPIAGLARIERLQLTGSQITNLTALANLTKLKDLWISNTSIDDLTPLAGHSKLERLNLDNTNVTDITALLDLKKLKFLWLDSVKINDEQIKKLERALPNCTIIVNPKLPIFGQRLPADRVNHWKVEIGLLMITEFP